MKIYLPLFASALILIPSGTHAQGIPVYDAAGFTQAVSQIEQMAKDYQKQIEQLNESIKQTSALTGPRNAGDILNGITEQQLHDYLPDELLDLGTGNHPADMRYNDLIDLYGLDQGQNILPQEDPQSPYVRSVTEKNKSIMATMASSEQAYQNTGERTALYKGLLEQLNSTADLKDSADLQARIAVENGLALNELIRLSTINMQREASDNVHQLMSERRAEAAHHYDPDLAKQAIAKQP